MGLDNKSFSSHRLLRAGLAKFSPLVAWWRGPADGYSNTNDLETLRRIPHFAPQRRSSVSNCAPVGSASASLECNSVSWPRDNRTRSRAPDWSFGSLAHGGRSRSRFVVTPLYRRRPSRTPPNGQGPAST